MDAAPQLELAPLNEALWAKHGFLMELLRGFDEVVVAYSGGVDSALLARLAHEAIGARALALTARSPSLLQPELEEAIALAREIGIRHEIVETNELSRPGYVQNEPSRCYYCKSELFDTAALVAARRPGTVVLDGYNQDDLHDFRPGHRAAAEHGVRHPLMEAGLSKAEVRTLSRALGLRSWQKPQLACLASRVPYGMEVTEERLAKVGAVEIELRRLGFFDLRARLVRENEDMVRIELGEAELPRLLDAALRARVVEAARAAGFRFVTLDLEGFRSGRMNEGLVRLGRPSGG